MNTETQREFPLQGAFSREPVFGFALFFSHLLSFYAKKIFFYNFIYLCLVLLGLCSCWSFSLAVGEQGLLFTAVHGFLTVAASLVMKHGLQGVRASVAAAPGL